MKKNLRPCKKGHQFNKSIDYPICPACEEKRKPKDSFLSILGAPARRSLEREGVSTLQKLASHKETDILKLHGMGKSSIPKLKAALIKTGLSFHKES